VRTRRALVPLVLVACFALGACGGDDGDDGDDSAGGGKSPTSEDTQADVRACGLLSTDEVAAAVGSPVKPGIATNGPAITGGGFTTCVWQSADPDNPADTATLTIYPNADAADSVRDADSVDVDGIGDDAFSVSFAGIWVYDGEKSFLAQWYAFSGTDEEHLPKSEALAKAAADAL
jgi:hypothetical protein